MLFLKSDCSLEWNGHDKAAKSSSRNWPGREMTSSKTKQVRVVWRTNAGLDQEYETCKFINESFKVRKVFVIVSRSIEQNS